MRADRLHLGEKALVYRLAYNGDVLLQRIPTIQL